MKQQSKFGIRRPVGRLLTVCVVVLLAGCAAGNRLEPRLATSKDAIESFQIQPPGALVIGVFGL